MKTLKSFFTSLVVLLAVTGCGESFKGQSLNSENTTSPVTNNQPVFGDNGFRNSFTDLNVDRQAALLYQAEQQGKESQTVSLTNSIRAFDFAMTVDSTNTQYKLDSRITLGCNNFIDFSRTVTLADLQSLRPVDTGTVQGHSVRIQCTNVACTEVIAAVSRHGGLFEGTVLVGLAANTRNNNVLNYVGRNVNYTPYFATFTNAAVFSQNNNCPAPPQSIRDQIFGAVTERVNEVVIRETIGFLEDLFR